MPLIEFTRRGYIEVYDADGNKISQHTLEREAIERVSNLILEQPAGKESKFEIRGPLIVAKGYGVLSPGGGDTTAPTTPGSLTGLATSATTIALSWTQSTDNIGVAGYQVFRNGAALATTSSLSYNDSGLTPSTQYSYTVTAYDAAGNNSSAAGPALVTTNSNSAPVWSLGNQSYDNGDAVNIALDGVCSDADGDPITYSLVSGSLPTGLALSGARNQTLSGTVTSDGTYAFTLGASDGIAAVQNVAVTFTVSTPDTTAPDAPSAPTVLASTSSTITLSLPTSGAGDHASYTIQRSADGVSYGNRATGITASTWQDTGLSASTTYYYRLLDVDTSGNISAAGAAVSRQTSAPSSAPYDLYATDIQSRGTIPFAVNWATAPNITSELRVTTNAAFLASIQVSGRKTIVAPGTYSAITGFANDGWIELEDGVVISAGPENKGLHTGGQRQRVTGTSSNASSASAPRILGGWRGYNGAADIHVQGVKFYPIGSTASSTGTGTTDIDLRQVTRVTFLGNHVLAVSGQYTFFAVDWIDDLVMANNQIETSGSAAGPWRLGNGRNRLTFVDNRVRGTTGYAIWRLHNQSQYVWFRGNQMEANTQGLWLDTYTAPSPSGGAQSDIWIYDNRWYGLDSFGNGSPSLAVRDNGTYPVTNLRVNGDIWYSNAGSPGTQIISASGRPTWTIGSNTYQAVTTPPTWNFR